MNTMPERGHAQQQEAMTQGTVVSPLVGSFSRVYCTGGRPAAAKRRHRALQAGHRQADKKTMNWGMPSSRKAMTADAGMVDQRAVGHSVSGRKNSQMTRKREVCLMNHAQCHSEPLLRKCADAQAGRQHRAQLRGWKKISLLASPSAGRTVCN